jgi:hypothetical protein
MNQVAFAKGIQGRAVLNFSIQRSCVQVPKLNIIARTHGDDMEPLALSSKPQWMLIFFQSFVVGRFEFGSNMGEVLTNIPL